MSAQDADGGPGQFSRLLSRLSRGGPAPGGVLVDLAPLGSVTTGAAARLGLQYLRVRTRDAVAETTARDGTETFFADPSDPPALVDALVDALGGRPVAAVCIGDALNRVEDLGRYLLALRGLCTMLGNTPLLAASPNVTHLDVAAKLVIGRWDVTPTGTLASAYVRHFSDASLRSAMAAHGWREVDADDHPAVHSDQHFPVGAAPLERTTPIGSLLCSLREMAAAGTFVDRFVRVYVPADTEAGTSVGAGTGRTSPPFLSVLLRTQGRREATLGEALLCLAAQTCDDFEVLILLHDAEESTRSIRALVSEFGDSFSRKVRIVPVSGGGRCRPLNEGARLAIGQYVAMLDDDDLVLANWVESFRDGARRAPGHVVRTAVATQRVEAREGGWAGQDGYEVVDRPRLVFALDFDHLEHVLDNRTPTNGYAFPRSLATDLGLRWDETLPVLEDWDHLLWAASICGVTGVPTITALLRWWDLGEDSKSLHTPELWEATRQRVVDKHDAAPLLLDGGTFSRLRKRLIDGDVALEHVAKLEQDVRELSARLHAAHHRIESATRTLESTAAQLDEVRSSRSWRLTAPLRLVGQLARRLRR